MARLFFVMMAGLGVGSFMFIAGLTGGGFLMYKYMSIAEFEPPRVNYQTLEFPSSKAKLYLAAQRWGVTGNHEEVKVCTSPVELRADGTCLTFYTDELFYGRSSKTGLVVHVYPSAIPNCQVTKLGAIDIAIHELDVDKYKAMRRDYDRRGLMRIYAP